MNAERFLITLEEESIRLDQLLTQRFPDFSRTYFQYLIEKGLVLLNARPVKKRVCGRAGNEVEISFLHQPEISAKPQDIPLDILYEDEHLIAINKPSGMVVHPAPGNPDNTFVNALLFHLKSHDFVDYLRPGIVHRLDKETSGILIAAKHSKAHVKLVDCFSMREMKKEYLAICLNKPLVAELNLPIGRHATYRKKMCISEKGKSAKTLFSVLGFSDKISLVKASPITGRTHQIRVHLQHLGCPILGDSVYGNPSFNTKLQIPRQLLHAYSLSFIHPFTNKPLSLTAPPPPDMSSWIKKITI